MPSKNWGRNIASSAKFIQIHLARILLPLFLVFLASSLIVGFAIHREINRFHEKTAWATRNTSDLIAKSTEALIRKIDISLQAGANRYQATIGTPSFDPQSISNLLTQHTSINTEVSGFSIANAHGIVLYGEDVRDTALKDLGKLAHFSSIPHGGSELTVSPPIRDEDIGEWVLYIYRPLFDRTDAFAGIIYAKLPVSAFRDILSTADLGEHGAATLRSRNGALVYRNPPPSHGIGNTLISADLDQILKSGNEFGNYMAETAIDGISRVNAYRKIKDLPLYAIVGMAPSDHQDGHIESILMFSLLWTISVAVVGLATYLLFRWARALQHESNRALALSQKLERVRSDLTQAQEIAKVGNWSMDTVSGQTYWSDEFVALMGVSPGANWSEVPAALQSRFAPADWECIRTAVRACREQGQDYDLDCQIAGPGEGNTWLNIRGEAARDAAGRVIRVHGTAQDITDRKKLQQQLDATNAQLTDLYDNAPCGYFSLNANGQYVRINQTLLTWLGITQAEALNRLGLKDAITDTGRFDLEGFFATLQSKGHIDEWEFEIRHQANGQTRKVSLTSTAIFDARGQFQMSRSVLFDVTDLRTAQTLLQKLLSERESILKSQTIGVAKFKNRKALWVNDAFQDLLGYSREDVLDKDSRMFYQNEADYQHVGKEAYQSLAKGGVYRTQIQLVHQNGRPIWVDLQGAVLDAEPGTSLWMFTDIDTLRADYTKLEHDALHDPLTGLANRNCLTAHIAKALAMAQRNQTRVVICFLDLDGFKPINDRHGHEAGDLVLTTIARRMQESVRTVDMVGRVGGDEFVIVLSGLTRSSDHQMVVERAMALMCEPIDVGHHTMVRVGVSLGMAESPTDGTSVEALMKTADERMYEHKRAKKRG